MPGRISRRPDCPLDARYRQPGTSVRVSQPITLLSDFTTAAPGVGTDATLRLVLDPSTVAGSA